MPESRPPIELHGLSLAELQKLIDERRLPPVDEWNPEHCGHSRHADRARRHLVPRGRADRPPGDGAAVLDRAAARARRPPRAGHAGREARHRRRIDRLPSHRDAQRGRRARPADRLRARQRRRGDPRPGSSAAGRRDAKRPLAAHPRPPRARGRACAAGLLRARRARARERRRSAGRLERRRVLPAGDRADDASPTGCAARSRRPPSEPPLDGDLPELRAQADIPAAVLSRSPIEPIPA